MSAPARLIARLALAAIVATTGLLVPPTSSVPAVRASVPDIPGEDLFQVATLDGSDLVVTGRLGGGVYDAVYRVELSAGQAMIATITSPSDGTDFDLYLYAGSATTVYSLDGVIAKSIGPTSEESIVHYARSDGTVYLDLNAYVQVPGPFTLRVGFTKDETIPSPVIVLNGGSSLTNDRRVTALIDGTDLISEVTAGSYSEDNGETWSAWTTTPFRHTWYLAGGDGTKTILAKVRDAAGNESPPAARSIVLDTTAPRILSMVPESFAIARPTITVGFDEQVTAASWRSGFTIRDDIGVAVAGTWAVSGATATFAPSVDLVTGVPYTASLRGVTDVAGNAADATSWTLRRLAPSRVTTSARSSTTVYGRVLTYYGTTSPGSTDVVLQGLPAGSTVWQDLRRTTSSAGSFRITVAPRFTGSYRLRIPATATHAASVTPAWKITVRRAIRIEGTGAGIIRRATRSSDVPVVAQITPAQAGLRVTLTLQQYVNRRWVTSLSRRLTSDASGEAKYVWTALRGTWRWRASVVGTSLLASNNSSWYRYSVR